MAENKQTALQEEDVDIITLEFEDGATVECEIMGIFDYADNEYIALIPHDDTDDVYIYGYKELDNGDFELSDIEDDDLFAKVVEEFDSIMDSEDEE